MIQTIIDTTRAALSLVQPDTTALDQIRLDAERNYLMNQGTKTEQVLSTPISIHTETGKNPKEINFQRIQISNKDFEIKYDQNKDKNDVAKITINTPNKTGFAAYKLGDGLSEDNFYVEGWKAFDLGKNTALIDGGFGLGKTIKPVYYGIVNIKNDKLFLEAALYNEGSKLLDMDKSFYGLAAYDFGNAYFGIGNKKGEHVALMGIKDFKDIGHISMLTYDPKTKKFWTKSMTGIGNVDKGFYSKGLFDAALEYFAIPAFFPLHFSPETSKGDYVLTLFGVGDDKSQEIEAQVGFRNKIVEVGTGINTLTQDGKTESGLVVELNKPFENILGIEKLNGNAEARYNTRTQSVEGYLQLNYQIK